MEGNYDHLAQRNEVKTSEGSLLQGEEKYHVLVSSENGFYY